MSRAVVVFGYRRDADMMRQQIVTHPHNIIRAIRDLRQPVFRRGRGRLLQLDLLIHPNGKARMRGGTAAVGGAGRWAEELRVKLGSLLAIRYEQPDVVDARDVGALRGVLRARLRRGQM